MEQQLGFYLNVDRCVQCHACEVVCRTHNGVSRGSRLRQVVGVWAGKYPDLIHRNFSFACMHCGEPDCVTACPNAAISKRAEDGIVVVDQDRCDGCKDCAEACPFGVIQFGKDGSMHKCDFCIDRLAEERQPACVETCPAEALSFGTMEALSRLESAQPLSGSNRPSMWVSCNEWSVLEPFLPWKSRSNTPP